ncbi:hypothetical protein KBZ94_39055 [Streptomyces sp. RM72]|uniref:competence protein CoiA family protein n=1 Tax=Streptomyces sp. RM72 TaxID=1115510 RepID=UPI001B395683|nr:hypothetical protein [Streptomyces sp. RM72]MBQ0890853.1 hypothetical protein [Streptomyces sp. RM72]
MANGVFHTGHGIEINLTYEDLGNPGYAGLLEEITQPVDQRSRSLLQCLKNYRGEDCQCALAGKSPWMFVRRRRRHGQVTWVAAHLPLTHAATPQESDKHKAMKERIARTAARHGLGVETEARSSDGRVVTDVLVTGAGARVGWEAQYSPITANTVRRRSAKARERNIAPLWVTSDDSSALIDRAPWTRVDDVPWQRIVSPLALIIRGGVRHLQIWKCTPSSERPCPTAGGSCRMWHSGWFLPALCIPQERATALDELVVTSADGEHLPVRSRDPQDARRTSYLWALARDVDRWRETTAETGDTSEPGPVDDEPVTYREQELDISCRYGEEGPHTSSPRPPRDRASAIGLHTFGHAPADALLQPSRPVALRLSPRERLVVAAELRCPPWEVGPCMLCAAPIHRYGPRSPKVCPACRMTTSS